MFEFYVLYLRLILLLIDYIFFIIKLLGIKGGKKSEVLCILEFWSIFYENWVKGYGNYRFNI